MMQLQSYLQDQWLTGEGEGSPLRDPRSGDEIARTSTRGLDLAAALEHARSVGGPALRGLTFAERGLLLANVSSALHRIRDELLELSQRNAGATRGDAKFDVDGATATLSAYAGIGKELGSRRWLADGESLPIGRSPRYVGTHVRVPLRGVAVHVNAFNFPVWGLAEKLACAWLAGMPVLTKPATSTALPAWRAARAIVESGALPPGTWSFLCGDAGDLLTHLRCQDVVAFTGSASTGARIRSLPNIIEHAVRVNIEADSLNAVVVGPDVEPGSDTWELFLRELVREITQKAGQKCTATRRAFLPADLVDPAIEALRDRLAEFATGGGENARLGTLSAPSQIAEVRRGLEQLAKVAEVVVGELPPDGEQAFMPPVVFLCRTPATTTLVHELEVFGPVTTLLPYGGTAGEAATLVARGGGSLVATIYSDDVEFTEHALLELAPWHGRILLGSAKVAEHSTGPGMVLPTLVHGGPGRAGGGLELGGRRGLDLYLQTCAVQGSRPVIDRILGTGGAKP